MEVAEKPLARPHDDAADRADAVLIVARPRRIALCELDDPGLDLDIDRPEDYENALARAGLPRTPSGSGRRGQGSLTDATFLDQHEVGLAFGEPDG